MPQFTKLQLAVPALVVLVAAAAGGSQVWGQHEARTRLDEMLASLPPGSSGHYARMGFNLFTRTLRIGDLTIMRDGQRSVSIHDIVLHHLDGNGSADSPFQATALRMDDVELWRGGHSVTAALVQAENVALLAPGVPPPPDTPSWLVAPGSATLLAAGSASAEGIADDQGATLGAISLSGFDAGRLQQVSAARFADRQGNRIAAAAASGLDLDGLDRVFDTARYTPGGAAWTVPRPLLDHAEIDGFASRSATGSGGFDRLIVDGFAARPFLAAPTPATVQTSAFARDAAEALSLGSLSLAGLQFTDSQTKLAGKLGTLSATGYANGALGQFAFENLAVTGQPPAQVSIGQFGLTGLNATKLLHAPPSESLDGLMELASNGGFRLAGLTLAQVSVTAANGVPVALTSLAETVSGTSPVESTVTLRGLSIPGAADAQLAQALEQLGIDSMVLDLDEALSFDAASGNTMIKRMVLTARGLGTLSLSGQLTNVPHDVAVGDGLAALNQIGIGPFTVTFTNDTLVQRAIAAQAKQSGKTVEAVTDQVRLAASFMAAAVVPGQPDAGEQVAAFIANPKVLTITAAPTAPVPLGTFDAGTLGDAQKALNLSLSAQ